MRSRPVILASSSPARAALLENAGVACEILPAHIDEQEIKAGLAAEGASPADVAAALARLKAERISAARRDAVVIGADQILALGTEMFDKPQDLDEAIGHIERLNGRTHDLITAVSIAENGRQVWNAEDTARLTMRPLSGKFIKHYIKEGGDSLLASVGAYRLEGIGAQLFSRIEGDYFTILGLPLLAVLDFLRQREVLPT